MGLAKEQSKAELAIILKYGSLEEAWNVWGEEAAPGVRLLKDWEKTTLLNWVNDDLMEIKS